MVIDSINNASSYYGLGEGVAASLKWLRDTDLASIDLGRHEIGGGRYALVQEYETRRVEDSLWEAHRKYIDVQYVVSGTEKMGYALLDGLETTTQYSDDNDAEMLKGQGDFLTMGESSFIILLPQDAHMPGIRDGRAGRMRKVVVKVPVG
jgi:YhcH/YjgK/YiaL family protein